MKTAAPTTIFILIFSLAISGCLGSGSGTVDPSGIEPVMRIRNAPIPVPIPNEKPTPPGRQTSAFQGPGGTTGSTVTVKQGETVYAISRRTGVDPRAIISANNLKPPYVLHPGDTLVLTGGRTYVVKRGDTLYAISRANGVDLTSLSRANNLRSPYRLEIGQVLIIPGGRAGSSSPQTTLNVALPPREGSRFLWPVRGDILSSYGAKDGGLHNDGINIKTRRGEPIKAADAGVVVYADDGLKGYGNLILIRHAGGWVTAYAHNDRILVKRGDAVKRGDVISWAGVTGDVTQAQLHFEIRKGTRAVNPLSYLEG